MKKCIFILLISFWGVNCLAQDSKKVGNEIRVLKVKDWRQKFLFFKKGFWDDYRDTIIAQVGVAEFEKIKKFSIVNNIPHELTLFDGFGKLNKAGKEVLYAKLDSLVTYKISSIIIKAEDGSDLPYAVLRAPYDENMNWDPKAKWDSVYFVFPEKFIVLAQ